MLLVVGMLLGRFMMIIPMLAMAGSLASRRHTPATSGTFPSTGLLWISLLAGVVVIVGALTYFPALALGPLVECNLHSNGSTFPSS